MTYLRILFSIAALLTLTTIMTAQSKMLGNIDLPNSGAEEAQADFREGMLLLHSFEYEDAAKAFKRAQGKDSTFGMAYWGEAMTHNHPVWNQQSEEAVKRILTGLAPSVEERAEFFATERERDYHLAMETLYGYTPESTGKSKEDRDDLFRESMRLLSEKYPDDDEATVLYALSILGSAHEGRDFTTYMQAASVAFKVWERNKMHPGAAHYLIHSFDDPVHAPLGLPMAKAYSEIAPSAAHAQHMTSHIFVALGMWDETVRANEVAQDVTNKRRADLGRDESVCGHYAYWLEYGYMQQDRESEARTMLQNCQDRIDGDPSDSERGYFASMRARYIIDSDSWDEVEDWSTEYEAGKWGARNYEFLNAMAAAKAGESDTAREKLELMWLKADADDDLAPILDKQVNAILLLNEGDTDAGIALLREAAEFEAALPVEFGPPTPVVQSHELLGTTLLDLGRYDEAKAALEVQVARTPGRVSSLHALANAVDALAADTAAN
jgi:tetratricopeptide (TPR) repeat protein